jgi:hypothetical protein
LNAWVWRYSPFEEVFVIAWVGTVENMLTAVVALHKA